MSVKVYIRSRVAWFDLCLERNPGSHMEDGLCVVEKKGREVVWKARDDRSLNSGGVGGVW